MWVKIDDRFPDHRKLAEIDSEILPWCGWLYVVGLCYCNRQLTDGHIPHGHVPRLVRFADPRLIASDGDPAILAAEELVRVGLWDKDETHYIVHDYHDYQPSRAEALADKEVKSKAGEAGARARWQNDGRPHGKTHGKPHGRRHGKTIADAMANSMANGCPVPDPVPLSDVLNSTSDEHGSSKPKPASKLHPDTRAFLAWWKWGYERYRKHPYHFTPAKDALLVSSLLHTYDLPRLKQLAMFLWHASSDAWIDGTDRGLNILHAKVNGLADRLAQQEALKGRPCAIAPEPAPEVAHVN